MAIPVKAIIPAHESANGRQLIDRECPCGERITFDGSDEDCPGCGAKYNAFGQRLRDDAPNLESDLNSDWLD